MVKAKNNEFNIDIDEMMEKAVHFGHRISKLCPKMADNVLGVRSTIHIIDLEKTADYLEKALRFISEIVKNNGVVLFVGTKIPLKNLLKETAKECDFPYVSERWLGGTFTNFKVIEKRVKLYKELLEEKKKDGFGKYTKKERIKMEKELEKMGVKFEGIKNMEKIPEAVFICDMVCDDICLKEAAAIGVKVVGIADTNADPSLIDYPIPANDDAITSVKYILEKVKETILKARS